MDLDALSDGLKQILNYRKTADRKIRQQEQKLKALEDELEKYKDFASRLHEKCLALEAQPCVLDGWDEKYLFDAHAVVNFKSLPGGRRRLVLERRGYPRMVLNGRAGDTFLRKAIQEANGRQRSSPASQEKQ